METPGCSLRRKQSEIPIALDSWESLVIGIARTGKMNKAPVQVSKLRNELSGLGPGALTTKSYFKTGELQGRLGSSLRPPLYLLSIHC